MIITAPAEAVGYHWVGAAGAAQPLPKESEVLRASCACQAFSSPPPPPPSSCPTGSRLGLQEGTYPALPLPAPFHPFHRAGGMPKSCLILDSAGAGRRRPGRGKAGPAVLWVWEQ